jgi:hypothetical protein
MENREKNLKFPRSNYIINDAKPKGRVPYGTRDYVAKFYIRGIILYAKKERKERLYTL